MTQLSKLLSLIVAAMLTTSSVAAPANLDDRGILDGILGGNGFLGGGSRSGGGGGASRYLGGGGGGGGGAAQAASGGPNPEQIASLLQSSQQSNGGQGGGLDIANLAKLYGQAQSGGAKQRRQLEGLGLGVADLVKGIAVGNNDFGSQYTEKYSGRPKQQSGGSGSQSQGQGQGQGRGQGSQQGSGSSGQGGFLDGILPF